MGPLRDPAQGCGSRRAHQEPSPIRPSRHRIARRIVAPVVVATGIAITAPGSFTMAQPASISQKRAEVAQLEAQLAEIDTKAAQAAEAYNGARYEQQQVEARIAVNTRRTTDTAKRLKASRHLLADRLRVMYANPEPTLVEVIASSDSVVTAMDGAQLLERIGQRDGNTVRDVRSDLDALKKTRRQLEIDEAEVKKQVAETERRRDEINALLAQRRAVVDGARGELRQMIAAEEARKRREAEMQKRRALEAQRAMQAAAAARQQQVAPSSPAAPSSPSSPTPSSPASSPAPAPATAPVGGGGDNARAVSIAMQYLGVPYVWGGASPSGFDCSGLMSYAYAQIGKDVPHYTGAIWAKFPKVSQGDLQPGDMVFFYSDLHHVGMYIGNGQFIHAPHTGDVVKISSLSERASVYAGAVRP